MNRLGATKLLIGIARCNVWLMVRVYVGMAEVNYRGCTVHSYYEGYVDLKPRSIKPVYKWAL